MKKLIIILQLLVLSFLSYAQADEVSGIIDKGVALSDFGLHEDAIVKYQQALKLDKNNLRAKYEIAYSYSALKRWRDALYYSYQVVEAKAELHLEACLLYGAALDNSGRVKQSIRFYKKCLQQYPNEHLVHYNYALSLLHVDDFIGAEAAVQKAIRANRYHLESHHLLSAIMQQKGDVLRSMLPLYFILLYDQHSPRAQEACTTLEKLWSMAAVRSGNTSIDLRISGLSTNNMAAIELGLGLTAANFMANDSLARLEQPYKLAEQTKQLFKLFDLPEDNQLDFFKHHYLDFFVLIVNSGHLEAYSMFITNCKYKEKVLLWITENNAGFKSFMDWMELHQ